MPLITLRDLGLSFGAPPLLEAVNLTIEPGERICLLGRNGEGKSTLLKIIAGELAPDEGEVTRAPGLKVARLDQTVPEARGGSVFDVVADGLEASAALLKRHHALCAALAEDAEPAALRELETVQAAMESAGAWEVERRVSEVISRLGLDPEADFDALSGGLKRRVLLARALAGGPDLLLLDEPTNHLDLEAITWLEEFLLDWRGSLLFVTHDRAFLQRLATRILELDRGRLTDWPGDYANYLRRREEREAAEAAQQARQDKLLDQEEHWIRQGIKARRTRNEGRVRRLQALRAEVRERRARQGRARFGIDAGERSGRLVCEAEGVTHGWGGRTLVRDLDLTILRGDRLGIVGPNGCGKTTLVRLLLGELQPDQGRIRLGTGLQVAHFDQLRATLDENATVLDNLALGSDRITVGGRTRHVMSYLKDFLFSPERARQPVAALSGGERNRLLLARLLARPANLLVLDEPTNDLDLETLELLEEKLLEYQGTLLVVSHDRAFLDNVVTELLVFEGDGRLSSHVGGYSDWLARRAQPAEKATARRARPEKPAPRRANRPPRLSYNEQRELAALPERIEALEARRAELEAALADPALYRDHPERARAQSQALAELVAELEAAYQRWEALEEKREAAALAARPDSR